MRAPAPLSLRANLVALVVLCVLPVAASAVLLGYFQYRQGGEQVRRQTLLEARHRVAALDREFAAIVAGMKVLATAPELVDDDLAGWHRRASAAAPTQNVDNYLLTDRDGRQRVNTLRPYGTPLPASGTPAQLAAVFATARPVITDVFVGPVTQRPVMAIGVPVVRDGAVRYSLNIGIAPRRFQALVEAGGLPADWLAAVLDSRGTIVARSHEPDRFVGHTVPADVLAQMAGGAEESFETVTVDGVRVVSSISGSALSGWRVIVGAPQEGLERQLLGLVTTAAAGVALAGLSGLWLALRIARRVTGAVEGLDAAARSLVDGRPVVLPAIRLQEAQSVGDALRQASDILQSTRHAAHHDALTGLSNRVLFGELLHRQLARAARHGRPFAVLMVDLDDLKPINDRHGHDAGDRALRAAARRIVHGTRAADAAARFGGDEFAVLLDDADLAQARVAAARLLEALAVPDAEYAEPLRASIGVALWPEAGRDGATLLNAADAALYDAKRSGKGCVRVAEPAAPLSPAPPG